MARQKPHRRPSKEEMDEKLAVLLDPEEAIKGFLAVDPESESEDSSEKP